MPVYNGERFLNQAINSVLNQSYDNWELLIINDGSTDRSEDIIRSYIDKRIRYFCQANQGVSAARNYGLQKMKGAFICFLDADDIYPKESLKSRIEIFQKDTLIDFVDGKVKVKDQDMQKTTRTYQPSYSGDPVSQLLKLNENCFFGPSWMIKKKTNRTYHFEQDLKYLEDMVFYLSICFQGESRYTYTDQSILYYRKGHVSALSNLKGLESGYKYFINYVKESEYGNEQLVGRLNKKIKRIMIKSYFRSFQFTNALRVFQKKLN